jgi:hypothetical protein
MMNGERTATARQVITAKEIAHLDDGDSLATKTTEAVDQRSQWPHSFPSTGGGRVSTIHPWLHGRTIDQAAAQHSYPVKDPEHWARSDPAGNQPHRDETMMQLTGGGRLDLDQVAATELVRVMGIKPTLVVWAKRKQWPLPGSSRCVHEGPLLAECRLSRRDCGAENRLTTDSSCCFAFR